eukprot:SAG31_NODE_5747_length_2347_cov_1.929270_1_plen_223_part_00
MDRHSERRLLRFQSHVDPSSVVRSCPTLLKGISPLLTADLLYVLRKAGHGDEIALVDCNFPAAECATKTITGTVVELTVDLPTAVEAVTTVYPLDYFVSCPAFYMAPSPGHELPPAGVEVLELLKNAVNANTDPAMPVKIEPIERFDFYERCRQCFAIVSCIGERRPCESVVDVVEHSIKFRHVITDENPLLTCFACALAFPDGNCILKKGVVGPDGKDLLP